MTELEARPVEGRIVQPGNAQIAARLTDDWLDGLPPATRSAYTGDLGHWHAWCELQGIDPLAARKQDVNRWITGQQEASAAKRSIARRVSAVASWYAMLAEATDNALPLTAGNPARTKRRPNPSRDDSPTLSLKPEQARALIAAADADSLRSGAIMRMLLQNGFRVGTITGARIEAIGEDDGHHVILVAGKGDTHRKAVLPPPAYAAIQRMLAERGNPKEGPLFVTSTGRPVDRHQVFRDIRRLARNAGIPTAARLSPHSARHSFANTAIRKGVSLHQLQDDMWHADPRTTEGYFKAAGLEKASAYVVAAELEPTNGDED